MAGKLNILHLNTYDKAGGAEQFVIDFLGYSGCNNRLLVKEKITVNDNIQAFHDSIIDRGLKFADWKLKRESYHNRLKTKLFLNEKLNFTFKKLRKHEWWQWADIIHLHNIHGGYFDIPALAQIEKEKPIVWTMHDMWAFTGGETYVFDNELYKIGDAHTPFIANYPLLNPWRDGRQQQMECKKRTYKQLGPKFAFVCVSNWLEKCFREAYVFNNRLNVRTIHNGINISVFKNHNSRNWKKPRVLFFNNSSPFKGAQLFKDILPHIEHNFDLYVIGNPISDFNGTQKSLPYITDRAALCELLNGIDVLIFPSLAENFSLTVLEAMACGVCVVGSAIGGIVEQIDESTGYLFNPKQPGGLTHALTMALADLDVCRSKGKNAALKVQAEFSETVMYDRYLQLYEKLLEK